MTLISKDDLQRLMQAQDQCSISIFMPTHPETSEIEQDQIRFKNLIRQAEKHCLDMGVPSKDMDNMLEKGWQLLREASFWRYAADGLAVFLSPDLFLNYRIPLKFEELLVTANRFHIKPLLPLFSSDGRFYVLALSQKQVRMVQCTRYSAMEVDLPELSGGLQQVLKYDDSGKTFQFHTGTTGGDGRKSAMFHGQGIGVDDAKNQIVQYFRQVDKTTWKILQNETALLILAGVDYLLPLYRSVCSYSNLADGGVQGNPDSLSVRKLHAKALEIVQPYFTESQEAAAARLRQYAGTGLASSDLREIVPATVQGRVDILFVTMGRQRWGTFNPAENQVQLLEEAKTGSEDLLNLIAVETLMHGGRVYAVQPEQMPETGSAAALFRF